jgi:hypothetical protein
LGYQFPEEKVTYTQKDTQLYALSIGAARDPLDASELKFVYENSDNFQVFPTFGVTTAFGLLSQLSSVPGMSFNPMMLLHGEQVSYFNLFTLVNYCCILIISLVADAGDQEAVGRLWHAH